MVDCVAADFWPRGKNCSGRGSCLTDDNLFANASTYYTTSYDFHCECESDWKATADLMFEPIDCDQHVPTIVILHTINLIVQALGLIYMVYCLCAVMAFESKEVIGSKLKFLIPGILAIVCCMTIEVLKISTDNDRLIGQDELVTIFFCAKMVLFWYSSFRGVLLYLEIMKKTVTRFMKNSDSIGFIPGEKHLMCVYLPTLTNFAPLFCFQFMEHHLLISRIYIAGSGWMVFALIFFWVRVLKALLKGMKSNLANLSEENRANSPMNGIIKEFDFQVKLFSSLYTIAASTVVLCAWKWTLRYLSYLYPFIYMAIPTFLSTIGSLVCTSSRKKLQKSRRSSTSTSFRSGTKVAPSAASSALTSKFSSEKELDLKYYPPNFDKKSIGLTVENTPKESNCSVWRPVGVMGVCIILILVFSVFTFTILPFMIIYAAIQRFRTYRRSTFKVDPKTLRIAVIGGGWNGVAIVKRLEEHGVRDISCFVKEDDIGGTWHPKNRYANLKLHSPAYMVEFPKFPYSQSRKERDCRLRGEDVLSYMQRYLANYDLRKYFHFNTLVKQIDCDSAERKAVLHLEHLTTGETERAKPFDWVIHASMTTKPMKPTFPGDDQFKGQILHASEVTQEIVDQVKAKNLKVAVIGGSKSSCDAMLNFISYIPDRNLAWVYRRPYHFMKLEYFVPERTILGKVKGLLHFLCFVFAIVAPALAWRMIWWLGYACTFADKKDWKNHWSTYSFGLLDRLQRSILQKFPNKFQGEISKMLSDSIVLQDGRTIKCDLLILATGYSNGLKELSLTKDGSKFELPSSGKLFQSSVVPSFPVMAMSQAVAIGVGPKGSIACTDLSLHYLCVSERLSEEQMKTKAEKSWHTVNMFQNILFSSGMWQKSPYFVMSIYLSGMVTYYEVIRFMIRYFIFGNLEYPINLNILPRQKH